LVLLVPDLGEVASDLQQHALVRRNLPRAFLLDALVKVVDRGAQRPGDLSDEAGAVAAAAQV